MTARTAVSMESTMQHPSTLPNEQFFIPDLCAAQAVLFAVLLAELVVLLHVLALGALATFEWRVLATASLFVQWNTLVCAALICRFRRLMQGLGPAFATTVCLGMVVAVCIASSAIVYRFYPLLLPGAGSLGDWILRNSLLALMLAAIVLRYSYLQQRVVVQQRSALQLRLDALQARIRPHFLFNTLNSIASLITVQPERAEKAIEDVAELFRAALHAEERESSLGRECRLCELYLGIEALRFEKRLRVSWDLDKTLDSAPLPALLIQPLVENAVYHGIAQCPEGGTIAIRSWAEDGFLNVEVRNPVANTASIPAGSGQQMAQDNIRERLEAQYGSAASFTTTVADSNYRAHVRMPLASGL